MLDKIQFINMEVVSSNFKLNSDDTEGGRYKVSFSKFSIRSEVDEDDENWLKMRIHPQVCGFKDGEGDPGPDDIPEFQVDLEMVLSFLINDSDFKIDEEFYKDNSWFFRNYITSSVKLATESILKYTRLGDIEMPWSNPQ